MQLIHLLEQVPVTKREGRIEREVNEIEFDSRAIREGAMFVAVKGTQVDGHKFIEKAILQGAQVVACEELPDQLDPEVTYLKIPDTQRALGRLYANFFGNPARKLKVIGITGTNGKTSVASLLHGLLQSMGYMSGLVSTIHYLVGDRVFPSSHTTPDPKQLHRLFAKMVEVGCEYCFMEVSSHALMQDRTEGIYFTGAVFTNITHDHLDYHGTFAEYIKAKKRLFDHLDSRAFALINLDDRNAKIMVQNSRARTRTFAMKRMADYRARILENTFEGLLLDIGGTEAWFKLLGSFNAYNLLTAYAVGVELGFSSHEVLTKLSLQGGIEGRFEAIHSPVLQLTAIVDYAHTPDALKSVLQTILDVNQGKAKVLTVVGCGGDRDKEKRPKMAAIAAKLSDQLILTSDNPRSEEPEMILKDMQNGINLEHKRKVLTIENRKEAIKTAVRLAKAHDIVLIAGKGHEAYQEIKGVRHPFDDRKVVSLAFEELGT